MIGIAIPMPAIALPRYEPPWGVWHNCDCRTIPKYGELFRSIYLDNGTFESQCPNFDFEDDEASFQKLLKNCNQ